MATRKVIAMIRAIFFLFSESPERQMMSENMQQKEKELLDNYENWHKTY